jgi:L-lactate permease
VTGPDTSADSLFGTLQVTAAKDAGLSPTLLAAANCVALLLGICALFTSRAKPVLSWMVP